MGDRLPDDMFSKTESSGKPAAKKGTSTAKRTKSRKNDETPPKRPTSKSTPSNVEPMARMTLVLRADQLRWLQRGSFEAKMRGDKNDMSAIVRKLVDQAMSRGEP
jgi:hypothetical protein